jgi:hypothetical protein
MRYLNIKYSVQQIVICDGLFVLGVLAGLLEEGRRRFYQDPLHMVRDPRGFTWQGGHVVRHPV